MGEVRRKSLLKGAFLSALMALGVAGCGGSSTETSSIVSAPTTGANQQVDRTSFIRQANSICAEANGAIDGLPAGTTNSASVVEQAGIVRGEVKSLESLGTPTSGKAQLDRYLAALDDLARELLREKKAIDSGGDTSVAATAVASAQSSAQSAARSLGAHACAGTTSPSGSATASGGATAGGGAVTPTTTVPVTPTATIPTTPVPTTPTATAAPPPPPSSGGAGTGSAGGGTSSGSGSSGGVGAP